MLKNAGNRIALLTAVLLLQACASQQPQQQTAAVDTLVEELSLLPPPSKVLIKTHCTRVATCVESGRSYDRRRDR